MTDNELIAKARDGDQKAHAALYTRYGPTIGAVRKHYGNMLPWWCYEDLLSVSNEGYVRAVKTYDSKRGTAFRTWLITECKHAFNLYIQKARALKRQHLECELVDAPVEPNTDTILLQLELDKLKGRDKRIVKYLLEELTYEEIGKKLHLTKQGAHIAAKALMARLKKRLSH